jgi:hypothetical protein
MKKTFFLCGPPLSQPTYPYGEQLKVDFVVELWYE